MVKVSLSCGLCRVCLLKLAALQSVESTLLTKTLNVTVKLQACYYIWLPYSCNETRSWFGCCSHDGKFFCDPRIRRSLIGFNDFSIVLSNQLDIHVFIPPERKILQFPILILKKWIANVKRYRGFFSVSIHLLKNVIHWNIGNRMHPQ